MPTSAHLAAQHGRPTNQKSQTLFSKKRKVNNSRRRIADLQAEYLWEIRRRTHFYFFNALFNAAQNGCPKTIKTKNRRFEKIKT
jgi:hypothetical protein